jgi:hypothetical protein
VEATIPLYTVNRVWVEKHDDDDDARDVLVQMDDGTLYTALFVTLPYLRRQMELSFELSKQVPDAVPVRYATFETPHVLVEHLDRDTIEDTIDNLITLEVFETLFTRVTDDEEAPTVTTNLPTCTRATQEVAAVVINEVLVVEDIEDNQQLPAVS